MLRVALLICLLHAGCLSFGDVQRVKEDAVHTTVSRDGTKIGAVVSGEGPPLVLVHGTTANHMRWERVLPLLNPHFKVYAMDRRGRGLSGDAADYSVRREFEDVAALVDSVGEPAMLLGHSFGALCAVEAALLTSNVRKLVLYEPYLPQYESVNVPAALEKLELLLAKGEAEAAVAMFLRELVGLPEHEVEALRHAAGWDIRVASAHTLVRETRAELSYEFDPARFKRLQVSTLFLSGSESARAMTLSTQAFHEALPDSRIAGLPGQQHVAMTSAPDLFATEVLRFLRQGTVRGEAERLSP
jgi:pimeloyl-ACP methyl ester carboxylesterase